MSSKKRFHIPAISAIGVEEVKSVLVENGYEPGSVQNTMESWIKRRRVPGRVLEHLLALAESKELQLNVSDLKVQELRAGQ